MDPATWGTLISGGLGALGGIMGGGGGDKFMSQKDLWGKHLIGDIKGIQDQILGLPIPEYFPDSTVADLDPAVVDAYNQMIGWGSGTGGDILSGQLGQGAAGLGSLYGGTDYLSGLVSGGGPQFTFDQGLYDQTLANLQPTMQGMYDDLTRDMYRDLEWSTLPGIDTAASMTGNMASTKAGVADAVASGMVDDRAADIASQLTSTATGLAQQAGMTGGQQNLMAQMGTQGDILSGYGQYAGLGLPGMMDAYNTGRGNIEMGLGGGMGFQDYQQQLINDQYNRYMYNQQAPWDYYGNQIGLLSSTTPAGAGVNPMQPNTPSTFDLGLQGAMAGMGLWNAFQPTPSATTTPSPLPGNTVAGYSAPAGGYGYNPFAYNPMTAAGFGVIPGY